MGDDLPEAHLLRARLEGVLLRRHEIRGAGHVGGVAAQRSLEGRGDGAEGLLRAGHRREGEGGKHSEDGDTLYTLHGTVTGWKGQKT